MEKLKELAEKLNGSYWEKGDKKRVYLDKGHNTKKMKTTTYVYQLDNGNFKVCCYIDCPSQNWNWIKSQQDKIIESVEDHIDEVLSDKVYVFVDDNGNTLNGGGDKEALNYLCSGSDYFYSFDKAQKVFNEQYMNVGDSIKEINIDEFESEVNRLDELDKPERQKKAEELRIKIKNEKKSENTKKEEAKKTQPSDTMFGVETKVSHSRFGIGVVVSETEEQIEIDFHDKEVKLKSLLKKFAKLKKVAQ